MAEANTNRTFTSFLMSFCLQTRSSPVRSCWRQYGGHQISFLQCLLPFWSIGAVISRQAISCLLLSSSQKTAHWTRRCVQLYAK